MKLGGRGAMKFMCMQWYNWCLELSTPSLIAVCRWNEEHPDDIVGFIFICMSTGLYGKTCDKWLQGKDMLLLDRSTIQIWSAFLAAMPLLPELDSPKSEPTAQKQPRQSRWS